LDEVLRNRAAEQQTEDNRCGRGEVMKWNELRGINLIEWEGQMMMVKDAVDDWNGLEEYIDNKFVTPVELTDDLWLQCGFRKKESMECPYWCIDKMPALRIYEDGRVEYNYQIIKYLHELQNLYFVLTSYELEFNQEYDLTKDGQKFFD